VPLILLGRSCPLQIILLCDLVGYADSNVGLAHFFKKLMYSEQPLLSAAGPTQQVKNKKKCAKWLSAGGCHTRLDGQHCLLGIYHSVFSRAEKLDLERIKTVLS
jgi:hypothetical protein